MLSPLDIFNLSLYVSVMNYEKTQTKGVDRRAFMGGLLAFLALPSANSQAGILSDIKKAFDKIKGALDKVQDDYKLGKLYKEWEKEFTKQDLVLLEQTFDSVFNYLKDNFLNILLHKKYKKKLLELLEPALMLFMAKADKICSGKMKYTKHLLKKLEKLLDKEDRKILSQITNCQND